MICHRKEKKDFVDITILRDKFTFAEMLGFYSEKFPMNDKRIVLTQILDTDGWEYSVEPAMLIDLTPDQAFRLIDQKVRAFSEEQVKAKDSLHEERMKRIADLLNKKNEGPQSKKGKSL